MRANCVMKKLKELLLILVFLCCQEVWGGEVFQLEELPRTLTLAPGESYLVLGSEINRVISGNPDVLEVAVLSEGELVLHSRAVGQTNLIISARGNYQQTKVIVVGSKGWEPEEIASAIGLEEVRVRKKGNTALLEGVVGCQQELERAEEIARLYAPEVLNHLTVPVNTKEQVAIKVRIVEISQKSWERLGVLWGAELGGPDGQPLVGISTKGEVKLAAALHLLEAQGRAKLIAEPALLSIDGGEANFLAGGEMPIPVAVQEQVAIDWKTYGVKLDVSANLEGELIRVRLLPEVSHLDWNQGVSIGGSIVPALATRRAQTEVYLPSGGTVVIAGLGQQQISSSNRSLPWWKRLPLLGNLFRYESRERSSGELAIFLTAWRADGLQEPDFLEETELESEVRASVEAEAEMWHHVEK